MTDRIKREDVDSIDLSDVTSGETLPLVTPGEILLEEFMRPLGLTARVLAAEIGVPSNRISSIVNGSRAITAETAILLGRRLGTTAELWMNLQSNYELRVARKSMAA